jgi:hypothetical protein
MEQTLREPEPASHMEMEEEIIISTSATLASDSLKLAAHRSNTQKSENNDPGITTRDGDEQISDRYLRPSRSRHERTADIAAA